jgi:putative FmdB family regulatory protein
MPLYEYRCRPCGHNFEHLKLRPSHVAECPTCGSKDLERLISLTSMSSENTRQSSLQAAHRKIAAARDDRRRQEHHQLHEHFEDPVAGPRKSHAGDGVQND